MKSGYYFYRTKAKTMNFQDVQIGQQVVRSKGDYVVGRIGEVIEKDEVNQRVRVAWAGETKTWVSVNSVEPTFIPYEITPIYENKKGRAIWPKYVRK